MTPEQLAFHLHERCGLPETSVPQAIRYIRKYDSQARAEAIEEAAKECERIWKEAPNERTDSPLTSFRQNEISHGCVACAAAIRALNPKERP